MALWANELKFTLRYSQSQAQGLIAPPPIIGGMISCLPGLTYDALAHRGRLGPR